MRIGGIEWRRGAPRWWVVSVLGTAGLAAVCCLGLIVQEVTESDSGDGAMLLLFGLLTAGALWMVCGVIGLIAYDNARLSLIAPLVVVLAVALFWVELPAHVGWWLSKGSLDRAATECVPSETSARYGAYTIISVEPHEGGCLFSTGHGWYTKEGFAYFPTGAPQPKGEYGYRFEPYDGPWYRY
ncbi:hypothetical protein [Nocardia amikacinitolerans]|uniref:hypothetical protein n=1 Tax=Nocardia amikacinitolerans TaxID=756689 RepID=UPI0020A47E08|nr:hypothetical protein [Nocardia amikacinitolerans]